MRPVRPGEMAAGGWCWPVIGHRGLILLCDWLLAQATQAARPREREREITSNQTAKPQSVYTSGWGVATEMGKVNTKFHIADQNVCCQFS